MTMYSCRLPDGQTPRALNVADLLWVPSDQLTEYDFPPADEKTMSKLLGVGRD